MENFTFTSDFILTAFAVSFFALLAIIILVKVKKDRRQKIKNRHESSSRNSFVKTEQIPLKVEEVKGSNEHKKPVRYSIEENTAIHAKLPSSGIKNLYSTDKRGIRFKKYSGTGIPPQSKNGKNIFWG